MKKLQFFILFLAFAFQTKAQQENCHLQPPSYNISFGSGSVDQLNTLVSSRYARVSHHCPSDGHFTITPGTAGCFRGDWHTLNEDHSAGAGGNMLLVNSSPFRGIFFNAPVTGLKSKTRYQFSVWLMNICRITEKCPFPLLPDITIHLQTTAGKNVALLSVGELARVHTPLWSQYDFIFTTPASAGDLKLIMVNHAPGGCGNDFVMDDITIRECIIPPPAIARKKAEEAKRKSPVTVTPVAKKTGQTAVKKTTVKPVTKTTVVKSAVKPPAPQTKKTTAKPVAKAVTPAAEKKAPRSVPKTGIKPLTGLSRIPADTITAARPAVRSRAFVLPPPPPPLKSRANIVVSTIPVSAGKIRIDLYDNGEIDGDTVTIYHNNRMHTARARLSQKPLTFYITVSATQPRHELTMVAENLGSIPPNTSLMVVTAGDKRHEVYISSSRQKNAKVIFDLGE